MRRYSDLEELHVRLGSSLRDWRQSGLLSRDEGLRCESDLPTDLRRTRPVLRLIIGLFGLLATGAVVALILVTIGDSFNERQDAIVFAVLGAAMFAAADALVGRFRLYRYGIEEALAAVAVVLFGAAAFIGVAAVAHAHQTAVYEATLITCAVASSAVFARFGYRYAAIAATFFVVLLPVGFRTGEVTIRLEIAALALAGCLVAHIVMRGTSEQRRRDATVVMAAAIAAAYLAFNRVVPALTLGIATAAVPQSFRWISFLMMWVIPAAAVAYGISRREVVVMRIGVALALVTLATGKQNLGWPAHPWDPMLLGAVLMGAAVALRQWLLRGEGGMRAGFTPARILRSDADLLQMASVASAGIHLQSQRPAPVEGPPLFDGGRSGGGGGGATF